QVAQLLLEAVLFVPHHGEEADGRRAVPLADLGGRSQAGRQPDQRGIAQVRIEDDRGGEPERDLHRGTLTQARGAPPRSSATELRQGLTRVRVAATLPRDP